MKLAIVAALASIIAAPAYAITLNFDDLAGSSQIMTYNGYDFGNFFALDTEGFPQSGYVNGVISPSNVAYNGSGNPATISAATPFSLTSGYIAAAWNDGLTVTVIGSLSGAQVFSQSFVVDTSHSVFEVFDHALIDTVAFSTSGGIHHAGYNAGRGTQLSLDDLTINGTLQVVPEPATWTLMIAGFGLVGGALRRPRVRTA